MRISGEVRDQLGLKFAVLFPHLDERQRRLLMGAEARILGHGGIRAVAQAAQVSETTVRKGVDELEAGAEPLRRVRRPGGGRKRAAEVDPELRPALLALVEPDMRGDPMSPLRWTTKSTRRLADELTRQGHRVSADTVADLLREESASPTAPPGPATPPPPVIRSTEGAQSYRARRPAAPLQDREEHNGGPSAMFDSRWMPPALSETLAAVTNTARRRPSVSTPIWRFAPRDLVARVDALAGRGHVGRGLDALGVEDAGAGLGISALGLPDQPSQETVELLEDAVLLPGSEVSVDGLPRGEVVWRVAPGDPGPVDVEDGVHDPAQIVLRRSADVQALPSPDCPPGCQSWFQQLPMGIGQGAWVRPLSARHVSVIPMAAVPPQGANRRDRGRVGIRQERRVRNGPSKAVICHKRRLRSSRPEAVRHLSCNEAPQSGKSALSGQAARPRSRTFAACSRVPGMRWR